MADLAGYLSAIMPSTQNDVVRDGGRWGVRVHLVDDQSVTMFLERTQWSSVLIQRIAVSETYPQVPIYFAYMVSGAAVSRAHARALVPLDRQTDELVRVRRDHEHVRLGEAVTYLQQVLDDRRTNRMGVVSAHKALGIIDDRIAELEDLTRNPRPGAPTPAGSDAVLPGERPDRSERAKKGS